MIKINMSSSFSFETSQDLLHILKSIHSSAASPGQKDSLRDLILLYTNGGKDASVKIQLEQQLAAARIVPVAKAVKKHASAKPPVSFGSYRNTPQFHTSQRPVKAAVTATSVKRNVTQASQSAEMPTSPAKPTAPNVAPKTKPTPTLAAVAPPKPATPSAVTSDINPTPVKDPLTRIREIKSLVNEKVGNPVHLVDIDNTVGREYMASLLNAMKTLNTGNNISGAMKRLEEAYVSVEKVIETKNRSAQESPAASDIKQVPTAAVSTPAPQPSVVNTPKPAPAPKPKVATSVPLPKPARPQVRSEVASVINSASPASPASVQPATPTAASAPSVIQERSDDSARRWRDAPERLAQFESRSPKKIPVEQNTPQSASPVPEPVSPVVSTASSTSVPVPAQPLSPQQSVPTPIRSLSETGQPLKTLSDLPESTAQTGGVMDTLQTPEVSAGLNQLLSDWTLFKKSGLFGTGAKGVEHPLFQKIKDLQVPVLLAGRFEGATQEIKQSITDYMNGWRYEQGIIYEQGETFEQYLRRVIRHILDLQK